MSSATDAPDHLTGEGTGPSGRPTVVAVAPRSAEWIDQAIADGGGTVFHLGEAQQAPDVTALVWTSPDKGTDLVSVLDANPQIDWVQLPWAGVEPYRHLFTDGRRWTCAKGAYGPPVAEHALALLLAGFRHLGPFACASEWGRQAGRRLEGARLAIVGGGGITTSLLALLAPFDCDITVVRRSPGPLTDDDRVGSPHPLARHRVVPVTELNEAITGVDALVLALALTEESRGMIGAGQLSLLAPGAWVVNVARGEHLDTDALVEALTSGHLGGAALDVTEPEPLPAGHPLWILDNVLITPHSANTRSMAAPLLAARISDNVTRYGRGEPLAGQVDTALGY